MIIAPAKGAIGLKHVHFTGDLKIDPNVTTYRRMVGIKYVGAPSRKIDMASLEIMRGMVDMSSSILLSLSLSLVIT